MDVLIVAGDEQPDLPRFQERLKQASQFVASVHPDTLLPDVHQKSFQGRQGCVDVDCLRQSFARALGFLDALAAGQVHKTDAAFFGFGGDVYCEDPMPP